MDGINLKPIAHIKTDFTEKFGIPRQSGCVESLIGKIVFLPEYRNPDALREIEGFSYLWLIFDFSKSHIDKWSPTIRPPRLGGNKKVGVFASRSPFRPNPIGLSCVKLLEVKDTEQYGKILVVGGVDILDNTPIYDIKPYLPFADSHPNALAGYTSDTYSYSLEVEFPDKLLELIPIDKREAVFECLKQDPRPSYQNDPERLYSMLFLNFDIQFIVKNGTLIVKKIEIK